MKEQYIEEDEIDLLELLTALLNKWWMIIFGGIMTATVAMFLTVYLITPKYESSAMLYVLNSTENNTSMTDLQIGASLTTDFEVIATSKPVLDAAIDAIEQQYDKVFTRKEILDMVNVSSESRILVINTNCEDPWDACIVANAMAEAVADKLATILTSKPSIVESAEISENPVSPSIVKNTLIGGVMGAFLVCAVIVVLFILNDRIATESDVEKYLQVSTLAVFPYVDRTTRKKEERMEKKAENKQKKMEKAQK